MALSFLGVLRSPFQRVAQSGVQGTCQLHHLASHLTTQPVTQTNSLGSTISFLSRKLEQLPLIAGGALSVFSVRNKKNAGRRNYFPEPNETKRLRMNSFKARMATPSGRKILMRRILKGRHAICHPDY